MAFYILWSALHKLPNIKSPKLQGRADEENVKFVKDTIGAYEELVSVCPPNYNKNQLKNKQKASGYCII